jgi:hypothetical protein
MKKLFTLLTAALFTVVLFAQSPDKMSYQAVIRNSSGVLVASSTVGMKISILQGSTSGTVVYAETQTPTTNINGLVSVEIGGGTVVTGNISTIDWSDGQYFIKSETDPEGGTSYTITGSSELMSVPYALMAKTVATYTETDPVFGAWDKSTGINITSSQVSDFQTSVSNNADVQANTAKNSYPTADATKLAAITGTNTGDETGASIRTKLGVSVLSGSNTGDDAINALYSGLVSNATHTGDATGSTALTVVGIHGTALGSLATGLLKNTTTTGVPSIAVAGTDYLAPTGSAALLTDFPTFNQNTTGTAASFTGSLSGDVTGTQSATVVSNSAVLSKVLTGYTSGAGTIAATDNILLAIQKLNGNDATNANLTGEVTSVGNATTIANKVTMTATLPVSVTGSPAVIASGAVAISIAPATQSAAGSMSSADKTKLDGLAPSAHYLGEFFDGGIIFHIFKGADGLEHGLIVNLSELTGATSQWSTNITTELGTNNWDGPANTALMLASATCPAATYVNGLGAGWYLPAFDELTFLFNNRLYVNKGIVAHGSGTPLLFGDYWSSSEFSGSEGLDLFFKEGKFYQGSKDSILGTVRAIRAF